jgi:hypothetical protein
MRQIARIAALAAVVAVPAGWAGDRDNDLRLPKICDPAVEYMPTDEVPSLGRECDLDYPSPDGQKIARVSGSTVTVVRDGHAFAVATIDSGRIVWNPDSTGFAVADSKGSGQTQSFTFVDANSAVPQWLTALQDASLSQFADLNRCHGAQWYVNTITDGWNASGEIRLVVQEGLHSEGCRTQNEMIGVVGNPKSGDLSRTLTADQVREEWCTPAERRAFGYCYAMGAR